MIGFMWDFDACRRSRWLHGPAADSALYRGFVFEDFEEFENFRDLSRLENEIY